MEKATDLFFRSLLGGLFLASDSHVFDFFLGILLIIGNMIEKVAIVHPLS